MNNKKRINIVELFSGIGSQHRAIKELGFNIKIIVMSEWFISAIKTYNLIHSFDEFKKFKNLENKKQISKDEILNFLYKFTLSFDSKKPSTNDKFKRMDKNKLFDIYLHIKFSNEYYNNFFDINQIKGEHFLKSKIDCLTYSFPCQDLSNQGLQKGLENGEKSKLIWQVLRILKEIYKIDKNKLPKILLMENVSSILNKKHFPKLKNFIKEIKKIGYSSEHNLFKASDYGSHTIRKRAFMISKLNNQKINWPKPKKIIQKKFKNILLNKIENYKQIKTFMSNIKLSELNFKTTKFGLKKSIIPENSKYFTKFSSENFIYHCDGLAPTLTATGAQSRLKIIDQKNKIRYLLPIECWRLTDFKDEDFKKIKDEISYNLQIFLVGNSIPVLLLKSILEVNLYE